MKKQGILHAKLMEALTSARHKDTIIILDAGMPVPPGCNYIDLGLVRGIPSFLEVLRALLREMVVEEYAIFDLMPQYNPVMYETIQGIMPNVPGKTMTQQEITALMHSAKAVIRTAEFGSSCNMVLFSASGMDKYVERFNVEPIED